jgi:hypothetical protein
MSNYREWFAYISAAGKENDLVNIWHDPWLKVRFAPSTFPALSTKQRCCSSYQSKSSATSFGQVLQLVKGELR